MGFLLSVVSLGERQNKAPGLACATKRGNPNCQKIHGCRDSMGKCCWLIHQMGPSGLERRAPRNLMRKNRDAHFTNDTRQQNFLFPCYENTDGPHGMSEIVTYKTLCFRDRRKTAFLFFLLTTQVSLTTLFF